MTKQEIIDKYCELQDMAISSKDVSKMDAISNASIRMLEYLTDYSMQRAIDVVTILEGAISYNNYLTESEAKQIVNKMINYDSTTGGKMRDSDQLFKYASDYDIDCDSKPYYNKWALYTTVNMIYSDQGGVILKWLDADQTKTYKMIFDVAIAKLADKDRPDWVRWYFDVD